MNTRSWRLGPPSLALILTFSPPTASGFGLDLRLASCAAVSCGFHKNGPQNPPIFLPVQLPAGPPSTGAMSGWRLVRTPGPDKNEIVSVMRTADIMQSDLEFAGMLIRCRTPSALQIAFVTITPFQPRSRAKVSVATKGAAIQFQAEVIPPGIWVALPNEAEVLAKGAWQSAKELTIDIEGDGAKIHGVVSLENLSGAIAQLQSSCPQ